jgi:hypothetical protein
MSAAPRTPYDDAFYDRETEQALQSARLVVPVLLTLIQPRSVIDIGCGRGAWLRAFDENKVEILRGIDGPWVDRSKLLVAADCFEPTDLSQPVTVSGRYDLAICLEVVEHLAHTTARRLIETLANLSSLVLFSAAVPGQGGTGHINEQWPLVWRSEFERHGFVRLDALRPLLLHDRRIASWYRQNIFLFATREALAASPALQAAQDPARWDTLDIIRRDILEDMISRQTSVRGLLSQAPGAGVRALRRRYDRLREGYVRARRWTTRWLSHEGRRT